MVEEKNRSGEMVKRYPLVAKMGKSAFECKPTFEDTGVSKTVEKAYKLGASLQCGRDLVEEYVAPRIWPLRRGWAPLHYHVKKIKSKQYKYLDFEVVWPRQFKSDEEYVAAVEPKACEIVGKFITKEKNLIIEILGIDYSQFNLVFDIGKTFMARENHLRLVVLRFLTFLGSPLRRGLALARLQRE